MDPRFRRRPSHLLLDDLAPQAFFELGEFRSLSQDVPLEDVPSQYIAVLPPEEAADDGFCRCDVYEEEEVEPHIVTAVTGACQATRFVPRARRLAFDAQRLVLPQTSFLDRLAALAHTQRSRMIERVAKACNGWV